ncbi:hypothetical protein RJ640_001743 [Escallonia rubra]|uniref:Regulator of Vps4 activity in the MVB pathway protein n=1 Tax=Escallonia rubra TaxID=112253 RepID=A0AA88RHL8_9ASTE|nr:hypothetical protein RJ640_001743 [Escallonia rubra]
MLHRSFKPAKCKTSLKLATSRTKLLKNKKGVQVNQMKKELAQLLESGQDQTARIRVEHVIREEKMIAAYDLIEIYSELIAARLTIIESQKNCPIDLKEAIASVIFASPRCAADVPELLDVRKHFTAKYGKEFITAAIELRPNSGVSRMLVEKLSAVAPDGPTKVKVLNAIADEHNIKWEPKAFGEKDPRLPDDLLSGPNTFDKASNMHSEPPKFEVPNIQAPANHDQKHDEHTNLSEQSIRSSVGTQNFSSADTGGGETMSASLHDTRYSGMGSERMEVRKSFAGDDNAFSRGKQNWNMEFTDATSAAQAAAESAERASMAARAAAELSSRGQITRQHSTESQKSNIRGQRDGGPRKYDTSKFSGEYHPENSMNNSFHDRNSRLQNEQADGKHEKPARATDFAELDNMAGAGLSSRGKISRQITAESYKSNVHDASKFPSEHIPEVSANSRNPKIQNGQRDGNERDKLSETADRFYSDGHGSVKRSSRSSSLRSSKVSMDDDKLASSVQKADRYSRESSFEEETRKAGKGLFSSEVSMKKQSRESEDEHVSDRQDSFKSANVDYFGEERMRRQSSSGSSHSHTSDFGDGYSASNSKNAVENSFVGIDHVSTHRDTTTLYDADAVAFDGSGSDDESSIFDIGAKYDEGESNLYFSSPVRKSSTHPSIDTDSWSPRSNMNNLAGKSTSQPHFSAEEKHSSPTFPEGLEKSSSKSSLAEDLVPVSFDDSDAPDSESEDELEKSMPSGTKDSSEGHFGSDKMAWLRSSGNLDSTEAQQKNEEVTELFMSSSKKFNSGEMSASQPSPSRGKSRVELNDLVTDSVFEVEDSDRTPVSPYRMKDNEFLKQSSSKSGKELNLGTLTGGLRNKGYRHPPYTRRPSDDVSSTSKNEDEESSTVIEHTIAPNVKSSFNSRVSTDTDKKSRPGAVISHSDSDTDDSTDAFPPEAISSSQELYAQKATKEVRAIPSVRRPVTYLDSDSGDSEEGLPKNTLPTRNRLGSGISRRTKASSSNVASSYSKVQDGSEASVDSKYAAERKPTRSSYGAETPLGPWSQTENPVQLGSYEQTSSAKQRASKPMPESNFLFLDGSEASVSSSSEDERIPTRSSYSAESPPKARSSRGSDQWRSREQPSSAKQVASKPIPESKPKVRDESAASLLSNFGVERASTRSSYGAETPPRHRSQTGSSDEWESREQPSSAKQVASKPIMESKTKVRDESVASGNSSSGAERSSIRGSYGAETPPKHRPQTGNSDQWGSRKQPSSANEPKPKVSSESVTSVNSNSGAERISTSSYGAETPPKHRSQTENSDQWGSRKQPSSADEPKPKVSSGSVTSVSSNSRAERISTSSYGAETPPKHRSQTGNSDQQGSRKQPSSANELKPKVSSDSVTSVSSNSRAERVSTSSYGAETPPKHQSQRGSADQLGSREQSSSGKQVATKPVPESKYPSREGSLKKSAVEQTSSPQRKASSPGSSDNPKTSTLRESTSIKESTDKRASHVHPKLPDYETLAAQFESLRANRK